MRILLNKIFVFFRQLIFRLLILFIICFCVFYYFYFFKDSDVGVITGKIRDINLREISGVVVSKKNADTLWVHNDSGNKSMIYAISKRGSVRERFEFDSVDFMDIEDISMYEDNGETYVVLADSGSNTRLGQKYPTRLIRFKEPDLLRDLNPLKSDQNNQNCFIKAVDIFELSFPVLPEYDKDNTNPILSMISENSEIKKLNIEALVIDENTNEIIVFTKSYYGKTHVLKLNINQLSKETTNELIYVGTLDIKALTEGYHVDIRHLLLTFVNFPYAVTGADLSSDGKILAIRTYGSVWKWEKENETEDLLTFIFNNQPTFVLSSFEPLGESIGIDSDGKGYFTISEGFFSKIYYNEMNKSEN